MKYTVVLPFAYKPYAVECINTMKFHEDNLLLVDNTVNNMGIMKSHNLGIDKMFADDSDWLIIVSAAVRFGEPGGLDFVDQLAEHSEHHVIEAAGVFGWHLIAFHRRTIELAGKWDENFTPYGFDDIDYSLRIQKALRLDNTKQLWEKVPVDVKDMGMGHSIKLAKVHAPASPLIDYFVRKWGRHPGAYQDRDFDFPFNDPRNSLQYWPQAANGSTWQLNDTRQISKL